MTTDVETPAPPAAPLDAAAPEWLATIAIGLTSILVAAIAAGLATVGGKAFIATLVHTDAADAQLGVALMNDGATLALLLGLIFVTRRDPLEPNSAHRRVTLLGLCIVLVAICVGDHVLVATRSAWTRTLVVGPDGDPIWRAVAVDGRHLAWALALAFTLTRVAELARRDARHTLARHARLNAVAWPSVAAAVVVGWRLREISGLEDPLDVTRLVAAVIELGLLVTTSLLIGWIEWRLARAWRIASRRPTEAVTTPDVDACIRCDYDLRGIADDTACPECGLHAGRSRTTATAHLRDAPPSWLRGIAVGIALVLLAELIGGAWPFAFDAIVRPNIVWNPAMVPLPSPTQGPRLFGIPVDVNVVVHAPFFLAAGTLFLGTWLLARPQRAGARDSVLRGTLRAFAILPLVALAMTAWVGRLAMTGRSSVVLPVAAIALLTAGCAPLPALMFALLRRLARRVLNANLAEHATIVGVGLSLTLVAIPLLAVTLTLVDDDDRGLGLSSHSDVPMILLLCTVVSFVLFAGWSAVNCIRFALAFRRAHREAAALWSDADLAPGR